MSDLPDWKTTPRDELRRLLIEYCGQGFSASQIASKFLNCGRSAVIGKIHRLKLQLKGGATGKGGRRKAGSEPTPKAQKPPARRASKLVQETVSWRGPNNPNWNDVKGRAEQRAKSPGLPAHLVAGEALRPIEAILVPTSRNLTLSELTEQTCKWPAGDPLTETFGFCGNHAPETGPYCRYHTRLAYEPPRTRRIADRNTERNFA
jgi:GcrA cell cycle regulator